MRRFACARTMRVAGLALALGAGLGCGGSPTAADSAATNPMASCLARATFGNPAQSPYVLPYPVGQSFRVFQTYCGANNHGRDNQLAYDIEMPLESPILAARAGVVVRVSDTHEDVPQTDPVFNSVHIQHDDGTVAFYAHLRQHSVTVQVGERVEAGQQVARCGYLGNPVAILLHFGVYRTWPTREGNDLAVNFRNAEGALDERGGLQPGTAYLALPF